MVFNETTESLERRIQAIVKDLIPLFAVSDGEFKEWEHPRIVRDLRGEDAIYQDYIKGIPGYAYLHNFIYFPLTSQFEFCFNDRILIHESSHYIHRWINPRVLDGIHVFLETGERPKGHSEWSESVAQYPNFILNNNSSHLIYSKAKKLFSLKGEAFLPAFARMSMQEGLRELQLASNEI